VSLRSILHFLFSFPNVRFPSLCQLCLIFFGIGSEVFKLARIYNAVCVRTLHRVAHGYECFWRTILGLSSQAIYKMETSRSDRKAISPHQKTANAKMSFVSCKTAREGSICYGSGLHYRCYIT